MTKCPTCGQWARKGQETCSHCGAMLTVISFSDAPHAATEEPRKIAPQPGRWDMHPTGPVFESAEEPGQADTTLDEDIPPLESSEPAPARRPPWIRVLIILAFFLFPIISSFLRNWSSFRSFEQRPSPPVLREVVISQSVAEGEPLRPQTKFTLQRDQGIAMVSRWTGSSEGHEFVVLWLEPQRGGAAERGARNGSAVVMSREKEGEAFSVSGGLALDAGMPEGAWEVRLLLDGQLRGSARFEIRK